MRDLIKKWWFFVILIFVFVTVIGIIIFEPEIKETSKDVSTNTSTINTTALTYPELKYFLEEQGYLFETSTMAEKTVNYTYFYNEKISIIATIITQDYKYMLEYCDKTLNNGKACCITDTSANISEEMQQQYNSYLKWKDSIGLTQEQIKEVLLKYYLENT